MRRRFRAKIPVMILCGIGIFFLFGFLVMTLWNAILPAVTSAKAINLWQSMGLLLLAKILFGGFGGRWSSRKRMWRERMHQKWQNMTPEERQKFKEEWRNRCNWRERWKQEPQEPGQQETGAS